MKQIHPHGCLAAVLAMITDRSEQYVIDWMGIQPPYHDTQALHYLIHHGFALGAGVNLDGKGFNPEKETFTVTFDFEGNPAYMVVRSATKDIDWHAIYWDGKRVHDPSPAMKDGISLERYQIFEAWPLIRINEGVAIGGNGK